METRPSIGRIVHFTRDGAEATPKPTAAIVTDISDDESTCDIVIFNRDGAEPIGNIPYSDEPKPGHWNWPPRK